jgi:arylsulfatase A-like enzyme
MDFQTSLAAVNGRTLLACGAWLAILTAIPCNASPHPNVVILYADDLGYGDPQCYNPDRGRISTPHIDRLAATGMRFTDGHSSSGVCSPSRYTLLTGRYHWRTRLQSGIVGLWGTPLIAPDRLTVAGLAKQHGYRTACIGKWHLGMDWPLDAAERALVSGFEGNKRTSSHGSADASVTAAHREAWQRIFARPIAGGPTARGFDRYFGTDVPNWPPYCFIDNDRTVGIPTTLLPAADFEHHRAGTQGPALEGWRLEDVLPALRDRAIAFIEESAAAGGPFLLYMPLTTPHTPLAVNDAWKGKSGLGNACADLIMETDAVVGDVLAALDRTGQTANTLVIFSSDNGFAPYVGAADLERQGHFPSGPFRGYKASAWEGGHRVPFIVRYPGIVPQGVVCDALVHQADVMATLAEILGAQLPDTAGEDSFSLMPLLRGGTAPIRRHAVSCSSDGAPAIRSGHWKLILAPAAKKQAAKVDAPAVELYDLAADPGETKNIAADHPERVAELRAAYATLVASGRSTPGTPQRNDVEIRIPE